VDLQGTGKPMLFLFGHPKMVVKIGKQSHPLGSCGWQFLAKS